LLVKSEAEWYNVAKAALCHFSLPDAFPGFPETERRARDA